MNLLGDQSEEDSRPLQRGSHLRTAQIVLVVIGVLALGCAAWMWIDARMYQARALRDFEAKLFHQKNAGSHRPTANNGAPQNEKPLLQAVPDGTPFARLKIDRLNMDTMVIEVVTDADLRRAVGHVPYTALPGNPGNVGLAGHRDTFFRQLRHIQKGDLISVTTSQGVHLYQVANTAIVRPDDGDILRATTRPMLTLVTCFPFYYVGSAPNRFIVQAVELQPGSGPAASDESASAGNNNTSLTR